MKLVIPYSIADTKKNVYFFGKLKIGAIRENGYLVGIYAMDGEKVEGPVQ